MAWLLLPENVQVQYLQKIAQMRKKYLRPQIFIDAVEANFLHEVQFSAAIGAAHFPAAFGMLLSQHPKEGAPFLGTALAEYKQSIEAQRLQSIFTFLSFFYKELKFPTPSEAAEVGL